MTCYYGGDTKELVDASAQILHILMTTYPGHNVKVYGYNSGVFHITHLDFEQVGGNWGMALKGRRFFSSSHMQTEVIRQFGEWLERANLRRGAANGDEIKKVDGVPEKNHASREKPDIDIESLAVRGHEFLRDTPRPQVMKALLDNNLLEDKWTG